jgi:hypothetical protein
MEILQLRNGPLEGVYNSAIMPSISRIHREYQLMKPVSFRDKDSEVHGVIGTKCLD